jgi:hypothetical protein
MNSAGCKSEITTPAGSSFQYSPTTSRNIPTELKTMADYFSAKLEILSIADIVLSMKDKYNPVNHMNFLWLLTYIV